MNENSNSRCGISTVSSFTNRRLIHDLRPQELAYIMGGSSTPQSEESVSSDQGIDIFLLTKGTFSITVGVMCILFAGKVLYGSVKFYNSHLQRGKR